MKTQRRRQVAACALVAMIAVLPSCAQDGQFKILGYTAGPLHDTGIRTVYVPIFQNTTFRRGLEFDVTRAVIREIESKTPWKVVSNRDNADTELLGKVVARDKRVTMVNNLGEIRDAETTLAVELVWRDLRANRAGDILSRPDGPVVPGGPVPAQPPVIVQSIAQFVPEIGESITTAEKRMVDRLAVQIVSMMEKPW